MSWRLLTVSFEMLGAWLLIGPGVASRSGYATVLWVGALEV
jgi:hypothetical protein